MKILTVVGARPQFIKAAILSNAIRATAGVDEALAHTGQHYDEKMSNLFFNELDISAPKYNLEVGSKSHGEQTGLMLAKIEEVLLKEKPDVVVVYGDTNSTLAGAIAASKLHIPIAHIEAGLRSFNRKMPEEINRVLTDHCSTWLFAPTEDAVKNLCNEGVDQNIIYNVGDVMYDVTLHFSEKAKEESTILEDLKLDSKAYVLSTIHRAENTDDPVRLMNMLKALSLLNQKIPVVLPMHPRTKKMLSLEQKDLIKDFKLIEPVGYLDMLSLEVGASMIATDSGGVQKEAFFSKVPCVTLRDETEWVELVDLGWNKLASPGLDHEEIYSIFSQQLESRGNSGEPYGNGTAAEQIIEVISN